MMDLYFLTLFPDIINQYFSESIMKRALEDHIIQVHAIDIRDFANNKHNRVDDYPYGGGAGMVMQAPPVIWSCHPISTQKYRAQIQASTDTRQGVYNTAMNQPIL